MQLKETILKGSQTIIPIKTLSEPEKHCYDRFLSLVNARNVLYSCLKCQAAQFRQEIHLFTAIDPA